MPPSPNGAERPMFPRRGKKSAASLRLSRNLLCSAATIVLCMRCTAVARFGAFRQRTSHEKYFRHDQPPVRLAPQSRAAGRGRTWRQPPVGTGAVRLQSRSAAGPIYIPADLPEGAPLVVVLHGCTQTAAVYDHGSGWSTLADRHGFAVLFPEQQRATTPISASTGSCPRHPPRQRRGAVDPPDDRGDGGRP